MGPLADAADCHKDLAVWPRNDNLRRAGLPPLQLGQFSPVYLLS